MKRLRSSDDLDSYGEKAASKEWGRREEESGSNRSLLHRSSFHKLDSGRKVASSFTRYERMEDDRDSSRSAKKRPDYDVDGYDRRKSYDRYRDGSGDRGIFSGSPRGEYIADRLHRSESFSGIKRDFPKGFRSERDRSRREGSVSSWRRFGGGKDSDEGIRSSGESVKISPMETDDVGTVKSPRRLKDVKSPPWSKDSGSEQSKSIEAKKTDQSPVDSGGNSSEMEEGELEPEPQSLPESQPTAEEQASYDAHHPKLASTPPMEHKQALERVNSSSEVNVEFGKMFVQKEQVEGTFSKDLHGVEKEVHELVDSENVKQLVGRVCNEVEIKANNAGAKDEGYSGENIVKEEVMESFAMRHDNLIEEQRGEKDAGIDLRRDENNLRKLNDRLLEANEVPPPVFSDAMVETTDSFKDRVKNVSPSVSDGNFAPIEQFRVTNISSGPVSCSENYIEGPSTRGLELFTSEPIKKTEKDVPLHINDKAKDENMVLDLSLSLPDVLLPIGYRNSEQAPSSPSHARSAQSFRSSFRTTSEGYTASMSFSGSQQFTHNPSCSLAHDSVDYEQSVKSRPAFQGFDWQALASEDPRSNEVPIVQSTLPNGNGLHQQLQESRGHSSGQPVTNQGIKLEGSLRTAGQERQRFSKQFPGVQPQKVKDVISPTQSMGTYDTGSGYAKDKKRATREKDGISLGRISYSDGRGQLWSVGSDYVESIISMVCTDPLNAVSQRFNEMSGQQLAIVKESTRDILVNPSKQWQRKTFQKALANRSDVTIETLMQSHRTQLEILVAMKTSLQEFLRSSIEISSTDLSEIFKNLRCRNLTCRSLLPVDECDCKICSKKGGFCSACMCLICSKFDTASNTCSWVGCDVCLHWCHADCGLRESYIRTGCSASGADGPTEMQFHCVACGHPSEMFGFVKEVFQNFAKEWTAETLSRELEYIRRIFSASEDLRGKRLHGVAVQLLSDLANSVDLHQVQRHILCFFSDMDDSLKHGSAATMPRSKLPMKDVENSNIIVGSSQENEWRRSGRSDKAPQSGKLVLFGEGIKDDKLSVKLDAQSSSPRGSVFDELESMVRIKHAEAQMFQGRADEARREAEALKHISVTKNEKIEEEYKSRISKLRLGDAEEMRKQKLEELQVVERAYQDYFHMKMRMEADIKDMLLKMEATRQNLIL